MKLIDLINKMNKEEVKVGYKFTLQYKDISLNTYEIQECSYGLMIYDLDLYKRFDSAEYILDYLDWDVIEVSE